MNLQSMLECTDVFASGLACLTRLRE